MSTKTKSRRPRRLKIDDEGRKKRLNRLVENKLIERVSDEEYRDKVRSVYGGTKGAFLATCSMLSLHEPLGHRIFKDRKFDLRGARRILDVGSGAGQLAKHVLRYSDPEAELVCSDLSEPMLRRARNRLRSDRPTYVTADLSRLPFADGTFDCITCGYVLEHLSDPRHGLSEMSRVLEPGGRLFLLTTEDNFGGAWTSRIWCCRTYNRNELKKICAELKLQWREEIWFTRVHKVFRAGGICVEIVKAK